MTVTHKMYKYYELPSYLEEIFDSRFQADLKIMVLGL